MLQLDSILQRRSFPLWKLRCVVFHNIVCLTTLPHRPSLVCYLLSTVEENEKKYVCHRTIVEVGDFLIEKGFEKATVDRFFW